jgi:hypothetical protein
MCVTNKGYTKYTCGHSEFTEDTDHCEDYVTHGECPDVSTNYFGSNTARGKVCSKCKPQAKTSGKEKASKGKDESGDGDNQATTSGYFLFAFC